MSANGLRQNAEQIGLNGQDRTSPAPSTPETVSPDENEEPQASGSGPSKPASPIDAAVCAEQLKEEGNAAFRDRKYDTAISFYSQAIDLQPNETTYLTNRAAANMALKRFTPALADCQQAAALQSEGPSSKILIRIARCQLATGASGPALSTLREVLELEPDNAVAKQLQAKVLELEAHLRNFERARSKKDWGMARIALDKCQRAIEGEGGHLPSEWRSWRIELELARGNWDGASAEANEALRLDPNSADITALRGLVLFLTAKLPAALQHAMSALRLDPDNALAKKLRQRVKAVVRLKDEGNASFKANQWQEAIDKYTEALDCIGENKEEGMGGQMRATLLSNRATSLLKLDRHDDALADINTSLELHPTSFKALRSRGRINVHLEQYEAAIRDFHSALETAASEGATADMRTLRTELHAAEVDLKRSKTKDYYKILGVSRECTDTDLKKAYRRESLKHHPDKGGDEEKFKLVSEAHSILSDPVKRNRYDAGEDIDGSMNSGPPGFGGMDQNDLANVFMQQFHGAAFSSMPAADGNGFHFRSGGPSHASFHF